MNRRSFIFGMLAAPFAALLSRFKPKAPHGGVIPASTSLIGQSSRDASEMFPPVEVEKVLVKGRLAIEGRRNSDGSIELTSCSLVDPSNSDYANAAREYYSIPWQEHPYYKTWKPRSWDFPLSGGNIPFKPRGTHLDKDAS